MVCAPSCVIEMEEVLLARITPGRKTASASFSTRSFKSSCSGTASTTKSAAASDWTSIAGRIRASAAAFSAFVDLALFYLPFEVLADRFQAAIQKALLDVAKNHAVSGAGKNVRDAIAHRPGAQHAYCFDLIRWHEFDDSGNGGNKGRNGCQSGIKRKHRLEPCLQKSSGLLGSQRF